jgi:hypothetical protein
LLAKGATMRDLIDLRRAQERIPQGTMTAVDKRDGIAMRFAKFYGFAETGQTILHAGTEFFLMEKQ